MNAQNQNELTAVESELKLEAIKLKAAELEANRLDSAKNLDRLTNNFIKSVSSQQETLHKMVLMPLVSHTFRFNDPVVIRNFLNSCMKVKGTIRVESIAYWFTHVCGIESKFDSTTNQFNAKFASRNNRPASYTSDLNIDFTYDKIHMEIIREKQNRYWTVASNKIEIKALKLNSDLSKIMASADKTMAKALLLSELTEEQIASYVSNTLIRVKKLAAEAKTQEWVADYLEQKSKSELNMEAEEVIEIEEQLVA